MKAFTSTNIGSAILISLAYCSAKLMLMPLATVRRILVLVFFFKSLIIFNDSRIFFQPSFINGEHTWLKTSSFGAGSVIYNWVGRLFLFFCCLQILAST